MGKRAWIGALAIAVSASDAGLAHAETASGSPETTRARFVQHEAYFASGFSSYASDRRLLVGLGGGPGYRLGLGRHFTAYAEARWLVYTGAVFTGALGFLYRLRIESWEPIVGLQGTAYAGDSLRVVSSATPDSPAPIAWAVQARLGLLRFVHEPFTVTSLALDWGYGADSGTLATAISLTFLDIGFRF